MAQVDIGKIKIVWKNAWDSATAYTVDDAVSHSGNSYICIQAGTNQNPSTATGYWSIMASAGSNGTNGTDADLLNIASTAQGDIYYNNGSAIARLAPGTANQVLQTGGSSANPSWGTVSSPIKKSYIKMFKGGQSLSGFSAASPAEVANYNCTITPTSTSSVFLATYSVAIGAHGDHAFLQAVAKVDGGSYEKLGTGKTAFYNSNSHFDFGSFYVGGDGNQVKVATHQFYYAPSTTSNIVFALYCGQHSSTAYFGRSYNSGTDDYTALGMTIRVDEYASSSDLVYQQYTSG